MTSAASADYHYTCPDSHTGLVENLTISSLGQLAQIHIEDVTMFGDLTADPNGPSMPGGYSFLRGQSQTN